MLDRKPIASLADRLSDAMNVRKLKASDLVRLTGIPKSAISHYINGYSANPDSKRVYLLANALNVNPVWLMGYDVSMQQTKDNVDYMYNLDDEQIMIEFAKQARTETVLYHYLEKFLLLSNDDRFAVEQMIEILYDKKNKRDKKERERK